MILAIETSASVCAVGFYSNGKTIVEYKSDEPMKHSELVGSFIEKGLSEINEQVTLVSVAIGPGSFTGLRIGLSYAQGFCFAKDIPIVGISNHQLLAKTGQPGKDTFTIIDAHRQELYLARHRSNELMDIDYHRIIRRQDLEKELTDNSQLLFVKGTIDNDTVRKLSLKNVLSISAQYKISLLSQMGLIKYRTQGGQSPEDLEPMYIRPFAGVQ